MILERRYSSSLIILNSDQSNERISSYSHDSSCYDRSYITSENIIKDLHNTKYSTNSEDCINSENIENKYNNSNNSKNNSICNNNNNGHKTINLTHSQSKNRSNSLQYNYKIDLKNYNDSSILYHHQHHHHHRRHRHNSNKDNDIENFNFNDNEQFYLNDIHSPTRLPRSPSYDESEIRYTELYHQEKNNYHNNNTQDMDNGLQLQNNENISVLGYDAGSIHRDIDLCAFDAITRGPSTDLNPNIVDSVSTLSDRKKRIIVRIVTVFSIILFLICFGMVALTLRLSEKIDAEIRKNINVANANMFPVITVNSSKIRNSGINEIDFVNSMETKINNGNDQLKLSTKPPLSTILALILPNNINNNNNNNNNISSVINSSNKDIIKNG